MYGDENIITHLAIIKKSIERIYIYKPAMDRLRCGVSVTIPSRQPIVKWSSAEEISTDSFEVKFPRNEYGGSLREKLVSEAVNRPVES